MSKRHVTVVDYGMGNLWSVKSALEYIGAVVEVSADPREVERSSWIVLPGVGSFFKAMETLRNTRLDSAIITAVQEKGAKILGICLGMQLLGSSSTEDGYCEGLGLVPGSVDRFKREVLGDLKIPHIGFNTVRFSENYGLFSGLPSECDFYFVHSYRMLPDAVSAQDSRIGLCDYGETFLAAFECGNICATQFHPEKSQTNGLRLLRNFLR